MHALVVRVDIDPTRGDEATELLQTVTIPAVKQVPGFVSALWCRAADGASGQGIVLFESEEAALAAAGRPDLGPPAGGPSTFVSAELLEVVVQT